MRCGLTVAQVLTDVKGTHHHHSSSPLFGGLKPVVTAYTAKVISSTPPWLMVSSGSDFASETSPCGDLTTPRVVSGRIEDREEFTNCLMRKELGSEYHAFPETRLMIDSISWNRPSSAQLFDFCAVSLPGLSADREGELEKQRGPMF